MALSLAAHAAIPLAMLSAPPPAEPEPELPPLTVTLYEPPPPPAAAAAPAGPAEPAPDRARPRPPVRPAPAPPPQVKPLLIDTAPVPEPEPLPELSDAQLAGARAAGAGSGAGAGGGSGAGGGQPCDMVRRLEGALRGDADVRAAVAQAHRARSGKAMLVWNGDWLRTSGQDGKGLAGVRQAIVMEVAFAPEACRAEPMRGLVLISMADAPGSARLVMGAGAWRWSDLLSARR